MELIEFIQEIASGLEKAVSQATPLLIAGVKLTIYISAMAIIIGVVLGLIACLMRMSKFRVIRWIAKAYVWVIRGTPMIVQVFFVHFGVTQLIAVAIPGFTFTAEQSGIITASLNAGAYISEIFRGGINAVPKGQTEAARSLGMSQGRTMSKVVLPQALKISIPSLVNQFIITIKDTSIISVIGLGELTNKARIYVGASYNYFATWLLVGIYYLVLISILTVISNKVEEKLSYDRKN